MLNARAARAAVHSLPASRVLAIPFGANN